MLLIALLLDAIIGEPKALWDRLPHPAVLMGRLVDWGDRRLNQGATRLLKGSLFTICATALVVILGIGLVLIPSANAIEIALATILLAHRSLVDHVRAVARALKSSVEEGRIAVSKIVGRDTAHMDESDVSRAAIESAAENFSDGVIAPAFWFLTFGLPGLLAYKFINTADSMIGYLNETYAAFGKLAARTDDIMNWIPARISGALLCMIGRKSGAWETMREEAQFHRSPNAGWPEAAMASILGVALAGPRSYEGKTTRDIFINGTGRRELDHQDIRRAVVMLWRAWGVVICVLALIVLILRIA